MTDCEEPRGTIGESSSHDVPTPPAPQPDDCYEREAEQSIVVDENGSRLVVPVALGGAAVAVVVELVRSSQEHMSLRELMLFWATATIGVGIFQMINSVCRAIWGQWKIARLLPLLKREVRDGVVILGAGIVAFLAVFVAELELFASALLAPVALVYGSHEREIEGVITDVGDTDGTAHVVLLPLGPRGITLKAAIEQNKDLQPWKFLGVVFPDERPGGISPTRKAIANLLVALVVAMVLTAALALAGELLSSNHGHASNPSSPPAAATTGRTPAKPTHEKTLRLRPRGPIGPRRPALVSPEANQWDQLCLSQPGAGAPVWAAKDLHDEYLGSENRDGVGALAAGCTSLVYAPLSAKGGFVYTVGTLPKHPKPLSIAIDSRRFGPAIFLDAAVGPVLEMISQGEIIGGQPPVRAANGEVYGITTTNGTVILARAEVHVTGTSATEPYVELPTAVSTAWFSAMTKRGKWLWPRQPLNRHGKLIYRLSRLGFGAGFEAEIVYDAQSRQATLIMDGGHTQFGPRGGTISDADLNQFTSSAL